MGQPVDSALPAVEVSAPDGNLRRWAISLIAVALLVAASAIAVILVRDDEAPAPVPVRRTDAVADLLGWIPATNETRRAFAVWSEDPGGTDATTVARAGMDPFLDRLALTPVPYTLGRSSRWRSQFGYGARDVTGWAAAGSDSSIAVLAGDFDVVTIEARLRDAGYRRSRYHGVTVYVLHEVATATASVDGDAVSAANAVALYAARVVTSPSAAAVRGAIDAAQGRVPSLADDPEVAKLVRTLAPISGLVAVDAADQAIDCGIGGTWTHRDLARPSGRYVAVGYGRLGVGGARRTLVAAGLADAATARAALDKYAAGWESGEVGAAAATAAVSAFGRVDSVGRTDNLLIAELVEGREDGWVRAGIRFASPVCEAAAGALPSAVPESSPASPT
jgi:hypothetical protein